MPSKKKHKSTTRTPRPRAKISNAAQPDVHARTVTSEPSPSPLRDEQTLAGRARNRVRALVLRALCFSALSAVASAFLFGA